MAKIQIYDMHSATIQLYINDEGYFREVSKDESIFGGNISGTFETLAGVEAGLLGFIAGRAVGNQIGRGIYYITH